MPDLIRHAKLRVTSAGFRQGEANPARFAAIEYVNELETAPNGSRITSTEKNVLKSLAQWYNPELGFAFPSMRKLAQRCSISERHCRRTVERLERKGVIRRVYMRKRDLGSQTTNEYFFPALGVPAETVQAQQARLQLQKIPRTRMASGVGRRRPRQLVTSAPQARTDVSAVPGHQRPSIESLRETISDSLGEGEGGVFRTLAATRTDVQVSNSETVLPNKARTAFNDLSIARTAWASALQKVREVNGAKEFRTYDFQDVRVSAVRASSGPSVILELRSQNPDRMLCGIENFRDTIARALRRHYGCEVKLECRDENESTVPKPVAPSARAAGGLGGEIAGSFPPGKSGTEASA
jgi:hypothetical protein